MSKKSGKKEVYVDVDKMKKISVANVEHSIKKLRSYRTKVKTAMAKGFNKDYCNKLIGQINDSIKVMKSLLSVANEVIHDFQKVDANASKAVAALGLKKSSSYKLSNKANSKLSNKKTKASKTKKTKTSSSETKNSKADKTKVENSKPANTKVSNNRKKTG